MVSSIFRDIYRQHPSFNKLEALLAGDSNEPVMIHGLTGSSRTVVMAGVLSQQPTTHVVLLPEKEDAAYFYNDLTSLLGDDNIFFFPGTYKRSVMYDQTEPANIILRAEVLNFLSSGRRKCIIVTYPESIMEKVVSKTNLKRNTLSIRKGAKLSIEFLEEVLREYNFKRTEFVYEPGQYSVRGSITDLFSYSADKPYRIDFFGEEVDSIRSFNPDDQLSLHLHEEIQVIPDIQELAIHEETDCFIDFIPPSSIIWSDNFDYIIEKTDNIWSQARTRSSRGEIADRRDLIITGRHLNELCSLHRQVFFGRGRPTEGAVSLMFHTEPQPAFNKNFDLLTSRLVSNTKEGYRNFIISESDVQEQRLKEIFAETDPATEYTPLLLNLHQGFTDHDLKIAVYTDHQIFDRYHKFKIRGFFTRRDSMTIRELTDLNPGDYVVHVDHGIGRFGGLEKMAVNGRMQEAIKLVFRDNDILYVGIHALHRISKYKGKDDTPPRINKLGTGAWQKIKQATKKKVKDIARDLIKLYAQRKASGGFAFTPDSYLQRELEASFIWEDTPDQLAATIAVKEDMELPMPMDRLVCGDVGFGKTEVAIRAAFKAATDGKQTAILVPTTILALQHYKTITSRLENFPCRVDYISRHRKPSEQKKILKQLQEGDIDIIVGTHKLTGKEIKFKDLGLLIIDEEQRFGVAVKERLKSLKAGVDTLTLTATPIPRTLQFSLMGARDLSVISTPPPNRMPIITELHGFNEDILREGIVYEVSRNGQVFFIHNRIDNIMEVKSTISNICPEVKIAVVHGRMDGEEIENVMFDFIRGDYDVLLATTIIESGLDIPNANTIFINDAHTFGLSDLHQLRGRVGRSNKKAFCYLLTPPLTTLTGEAKRRLRAIEENYELGSGFNIALQDLDIRGAGNLLGGEQSGFIADVGYETYQKILDEAVKELREEEFADLFPKTAHKNEPEADEGARLFVTDVTVETDLEIMFPDDYVSNIPERIRLYKELNEIRDETTLKAYEAHLTDRFGSLPPPARALLELVRLKWAASHTGIEKVILKNNILIANFVTNQTSQFYRSNLFVSVMNYVNRRQGNMTVKQNNSKLSLTVKNVTSVSQAIELLTKIISYHESNRDLKANL
ncbi:MAG: transcription-repair coupling factor [Bacteroidales bacterium]|jgi:transcription-repair coupling factor (superfamily II helicase)|nr:transcription-repair coupling factor [Bacteroidales bacterium]